MVIQVNDVNFPAEVLESDQPVLVDFWAPWCGPCMAMSPVVDQIAAEFNGRLKVVKVDVGEAPRTAAAYGVSSIPNLIVIESGKVKTQLPGMRSKETLVDALERCLNSLLTTA